MAGLDNIKKFEDGGEVPATDYSTEPVPTTTPIAGKGPYALGKYAGKTAVGEDILAKMEKLIAEREAQRGSFLESMRDAQAWWSGGVNGPGEALARRAAERENQQGTTFGMQKELAQYRASQQRAQELQRQNAGLFGGQSGGGQGGGQAAPNPYDFLQPAAKLEFQRLNAQDPDAANEYLRKMVAKNQEIESSFLANPSAYNQAERWNSATKQFEMTDPVEIRARQRAAMQANRPVVPTAPVAGGGGAPAPAAAPTAGAPITNVGNIRPQGQSTGFENYKTREEGLAGIDKNLQAYGNKGINTLEGVISRWSPPNENDTAGLIATASKRLGIKPNQPIDLSDPVTRQVIGSAIMLQEHGPKIFATGAPAAPAAQVAPAAVTAPAIAQTVTPGLPAHQQAKLAQQAAEKRMEAETKALGTELETSAKDFANRKAATIESAANADTNISNIKYLNNLVTTNPKTFGVLQHPTVLAAIGTVLEGGATVPGSGTANVKTIDEAVRKAMKGSSEDEIVAAQKAAQKFSELQLNTAKVVLKGQGSVSDNERALVANMTGSIKNSPAALRDILKWSEMRAVYDKRVGDAFDKWEENNPNQSFRKFMLTPEYKAMKLDYSEKINQFADTAGKYKTPTAAPTKPAGYDTWKKSQGQ